MSETSEDVKSEYAPREVLPFQELFRVQASLRETERIREETTADRTTRSNATENEANNNRSDVVEHKGTQPSEYEDEGNETDPEERVRHSAFCDNCSKTIYGVRHKCLDCPDWDFCSNCVDSAEHIHPRDRFKPIYKPEPPFYRYLPTEEGTHWTRLLLLRQGEPSDSVECLMHSYDLNTLKYVDESEKLLPYEALSYVWGSRDNLHEILVNDKPFKVTKNLHDALVAIRLPRITRILWVDAICIDQDNIEERCNQVAMMASIYRRAARVLIWLGHGDPDYVDPALTYLCQRANKVYLSFGWTRKVFGIGLASYKTCGEEISSDDLQLDDVRPNTAQYEAFCAFLRQPWFYRLWIVQEASLCKRATIYWHESSIDLAFVMVALDEWKQDSELLEPPKGLDNIVTIKSNRKYEHKAMPMPFAKMMYDLREFNCFDPRDRVYGLLGLRSYGTDPENGELFIRPDYNITAHDLYTQVAKKMIIEQNQPYLLSAVYHDSEFNVTLPSWVPDWSRPAPALDSFRIGGEIYTNSGPALDTYGIDVSLVTRPVDVEGNASDQTQEYLRIAGSYIAEIEKVTPVLTAAHIMNCFQDEEEDTQKLKDALKELCHEFDDEDILTAMLRHRVHPQKLLDAWPEKLFGYKDLYTFLTTPEDPKDEDDDQNELANRQREMPKKDYYSPIPEFGAMDALTLVMRNSPAAKKAREEERKKLPILPPPTRSALISRFRSALACLVDNRRLFTFTAVEHYAPPSPPSSLSSKSLSRTPLYDIQPRVGTAPSIVREDDIVAMLFGCFDFYILRDAPEQGFNYVSFLRGSDESKDVKGVRLLGTCDPAGYNYEWQVARHRIAERPIDYFEIF